MSLEKMSHFFLKKMFVCLFFNFCFLFLFFSFSIECVLYIKWALSGLRPFLTNKNPVKVMKNAFCFTLKVHFIHLNFGLDILVEKRFDLKDKVDFKIHDVTFAIYTFPNISRGKDLQFGQLVKYNVRNIFLEKSNTKCGGETRPRPFSEKSKLIIFLDRQSKVSCSLLLLYAKFRAIELN